MTSFAPCRTATLRTKSRASNIAAPKGLERRIRHMRHMSYMRGPGAIGPDVRAPRAAVMHLPSNESSAGYRADRDFMDDRLNR